MLDLVSQQRDESLGLPLEVQVYVEQLAVERLVHLLLPLGAARLLHGSLHSEPVQVAGQAAHEDPHVLCAVQGHAELRAGKVEGGAEEEKQRLEKAKTPRGKKKAVLQRSVGAMNV